MADPLAPPPLACRLAIAVRGVVQGVGFRPFVYNTARANGLSGWVLNEASTVRIEVEGPSEAVETFVAALKTSPPPQARIEHLDIRQVPCENGRAPAFEIRASTGQSAPQPTIPADLATCGECLAEIRDPAQRRHGYPFTNCTNCGPRWSIIRSVPYDRPRTSMARFPMCPDCRAEYEDPTDRRFHAQPIACPRCGPHLRLLDRNGKALVHGPGALQAATEAILAGQIVAIKGLGGFQLLVDATNAEAVMRLRQRKRRPDRPFAVMMASLDEVRRRCGVSGEEEAALRSAAAPILLLTRKRVEGDIAEVVAPGNPYLGVMLPYTPLHHLLTSTVSRPIVCTSGNLSEEPMAVTTADALERLGPIADVLLTHNRPIVRPVDDSVARVGPAGLQILRRARGFAPLPIRLAGTSPTILAVGGHLKNTVALALGNRGASRPVEVVLSSHIGDLDSVESVEVFRRAIDDLVDFFQVTPEVVACDLHPDYASTRHAESLAARWRVPLVRVQHHHAHVAACMAENELEGPVLGFSWDGTGYGSDGTVWGGEVLRCEGAEFTRVAHLRTFGLPGGDAAAREPRRVALAVMYEIMGDEAAKLQAAAFTPNELKTLLTLLARGVHCPRTSSLGRLFDAVAAVCGLPGVISFEGQAAMALEFAADPSVEDAYELLASGDWEPMLRAILADRAAGVPIGRISARFHNALAAWAVAVARASDCRHVALSGGCFQNALLAARVGSQLSAAGFIVHTHRRVPPGDGGIALGQVFIAAKQALR